MTALIAIFIYLFCSIPALVAADRINKKYRVRSVFTGEVFLDGPPFIATFIYLSLWPIVLINDLRTIPERRAKKLEALKVQLAEQRLARKTARDFSSLVGKKGEALTDLRNSGKILIDQAVWRAYSIVGFIPKDSQVVVVERQGNELRVKAI